VWIAPRCIWAPPNTSWMGKKVIQKNKKQHTKLAIIIMGTYNVGEMKHIYVFIVGREAYLGFYVGESSHSKKIMMGNECGLFKKKLKTLWVHP
jgi:hypothetical protein